MAKLIVMVGLSGSGKTTRAREYYSNATIISSDDIRASYFGDVNNQKHNGQVFDIMFKHTVRELMLGNDVVYDATNLSSKRRQSLIKNVRAAVGSNVSFRAHVVVTSYENCLVRNAARKRHVPVEVIKNQLLSFQTPTEEEGFDQIFLDHTESYEYRTFYICDRMHEMAEMNHDNPHHPDTIFTHSANVCKSMIEKCPSYIPQVLAAQIGFYHDIGKLYTKTFDEYGIAHYYKHAAPSAYIALVAPADGMNEYSHVVMSAVIGWHMKEYSYQTEDKYNTWLNTLPPLHQELLTMLNSADRLNSIS